MLLQPIRGIGGTFARQYYKLGASLVTQMVKNLPAMRETQVGSLSQKDPLEKGMATLSSVSVWRIPGAEEPDWL